MKKSIPRGKSAIAAFVLALVVAFANELLSPDSGSAVKESADRTSSGEPSAEGVGARESNAILAAAFRDRANDLQVRGAGEVVKVLPDDNKGSRHQRFLLELASGQTLLVAHNIDLAPRIPDLREGHAVGFYGEYEWTEKGGVIHWTHHDPGGRHLDGWLEHRGRRYE